MGKDAKADAGKIELLDMTQDQGGRVTQIYLRGRFDLAGDEALIVELRPGQCRFWNLHLANELSQTLEFMNRQIGLNGFTARADRDGAYRLVIPSTDPGVPNWLDTTGYTRGYFWGRLDRCDQRTDPIAIKLKQRVVATQAGRPGDGGGLRAERSTHRRFVFRAGETSCGVRAAACQRHPNDRDRIQRDVLLVVDALGDDPQR